MKLNGSVIFYWIHKKFPGSVYKNPSSDPNTMYGSPKFWSTHGDMRGHIVVVRSQDGQNVPARICDVLPVLIGGAYNFPSEHILLPENSDCFQVFNTLQEIFDLFQHWKESMERAVEQTCSFDAIIRSCDPILEDPICLADNHFRYVSYSRELAKSNGYEEKFVGEGNYLPLDYINQLTAMPDYRESELYQGIYQYNCVDHVYHKNVFYHGEFVGRLTLPHSDNEIKNQYYCSILHSVCTYVEQLYADMGSFWHRRSNSPRLGSMLQALLDGKRVEMDILMGLLANQGYRSGDELKLVQMRSHFITNDSKMTSALTSQLEKLWPGSCCMVQEQKLLVFMNMSHYMRSTDKLFNQELAVFLREGLLVAGISRSFTNIRNIQAAYLQTEIALDAGEQLNPTYWYHKYDDYAYWDLLHHGCRSFLPSQVCHPAINTLLSYDSVNNTELCPTLKMYLFHQYNAVSTANALCVARSTFLKRLARIEELTKIDLSQFETRLYLALSFALFDQYSHENGSIQT